MGIYFSSFLFGIAGAWLLSRYASIAGLIDHPSERSSHSKPTPKGGGICLLATFGLVAVLYSLPWEWGFAIGILSTVSLIGDRINLSAVFRLGVQLMASAVVASEFYRIPSNLSDLLLFIFFLLFITGTANFYNFMDGINGIAGLNGCVVFLMLGIYGVVTEQEPSLIVLCFAIAATCVGFLPFNMPRALVFMGDVGSVMLGFIFALLVVSFSSSISTFLLLCSFLFLFYLDELTSMVERLRKKQSLFKPHRQHLYQVLVNEVGIPHWKVSTLYVLAQMIITGSCWLAFSQNEVLFYFILLVFGVVFLMVNYQVKKHHTSIY